MLDNLVKCFKYLAFEKSGCCYKHLCIFRTVCFSSLYSLTSIEAKVDFPPLSLLALGRLSELSGASGRNCFLVDLIPFPDKWDVAHLNAYTPLAKVHGMFQYVISALRPFKLSMVYLLHSKADFCGELNYNIYSNLIKFQEGLLQNEWILSSQSLILEIDTNELQSFQNLIYTYIMTVLHCIGCNESGNTCSYLSVL